MQRYVTFLEESAGIELVLPVSPAAYQWPHEAAIETVTVDQLGDLNFFGGKKLGQTTLSVNAAVLIAGVTYREQDGSNDLYADITLRQYRRPETPTLPVQAAAEAAKSRDSATGAADRRSYTVQRGDTLYAIARKFYGDGALCWRLAAANGVKNANLIYPGQALTIPPLEQLPAAAAKPVSAQAAAATTVSIRRDGTTGKTAAAFSMEPKIKNLALEELRKLGGA